MKLILFYLKKIDGPYQFLFLFKMFNVNIKKVLFFDVNQLKSLVIILIINNYSILNGIRTYSHYSV